MKLDVINLDAKKVGDIELSDAVFGGAVRADLLARMVNYQLAKRRAGTHKTKTRAEVKHTTAKMFRQKGTGRARAGMKTVPQFRGGAKAHGPVVRDHGHKLNKKVRALALKTALSAKAKDGKLVVVSDITAKSPKTKDLVKSLEKLGWGSVLVVGGQEVDGNFAKAAGNIIGLDVLPTQGANVYDILRRDTLVLTKDAAEALEARLK